MKSVQVRSFLWSAFSCIRTEYGDLLRKSRKNSLFGHFSRSEDKEDCASIPTRSTKIKQITEYRQQKRQQFDLFQKARRSEVSNENCTINEASPKEIKHTWPAGTCVIVG